MSFLDGMARVLDLGGALETELPDVDFATDAEQIAGDWQRVGDDIREAADKLDRDR